jgi:DNA-binding helix-hairpin-helix protein with protein kinase domain
VRVVGIQGASYQLGAKIGEGGEGAVYDVTSHTGMLAKVYHRQPSQEKYLKLQALVRGKSDDILRIAAWPTDVVFDPITRQPIGFIMPKVADGKEVHLLYGPSTRINEFPSADWKFLLWAAQNIARAFGVIHQNGHVIGDVNHASILVNERATVKLIDCDSFQVTAGNHCYRCEVGVPTHTPPELQGVSFRNVNRTTDHDCFGLAVVIFQLLFIGRHPFAGIYPHRDLALEEKIKQSLFAYGINAGRLGIKQPPKTPPLEIVGAPVATLFERTFSLDAASRSSRPTALEWLQGLDSLTKSLKSCKIDPAHTYYHGLSYCPWCRVEKQLTFRLFTVFKSVYTQNTSDFNIDQIWATISQIPAPQLAPLSSARKTPYPKIEPHICRIKHQIIIQLSALTLAVIVTLIVSISLDALGGAFCVGSVIVVICWTAIMDSWKNARAGAAKELSVKKEQLESVKTQWKIAIGLDAYEQLMKELNSARDAYRNLGGYKNALIQQLHQTAQARQLKRWLLKHPIERANISGIGPGRSATLRSWGIITAADISRRAILAVPGFGEGLTEKLMGWHKSVEQRFKFDANAAVTPADLHQIDQQVVQRQDQLQQTLIQGRIRLQQIAQQSPHANEPFVPRVETLQRNIEQAQVNLSALTFFG